MKKKQENIDSCVSLLTRDNTKRSNAQTLKRSNAQTQRNPKDLKMDMDFKMDFKMEDMDDILSSLKIDVNDFYLIPDIMKIVFSYLIEKTSAGIHLGGVREGKWIWFSSVASNNGEVSVGDMIVADYVRGNACMEHMYSTGQIKTRIPIIRNNVPHGRSIKWHPGGQKKIEGYYEEGKRSGKWTQWREDGSIEVKRDYRKKVTNPRTGRKILVGGRLWERLEREGAFK